MMNQTTIKFDLYELLPANISNEAAFHVVKFVRDLSLALESIYFDQMLQHASACEYEPFQSEQEEKAPPF
jgi:hypothetical protein